jgi:hypothetical protein
VQCCRLVHLTGDVLLMLLMSVPYNPFGGNSWLRVVDADAGTVLHCPAMPLPWLCAGRCSQPSPMSYVEMNKSGISK